MNDVLAYASDPEWSRFLPVPSPYTVGDAEEFVARQILKNWDEAPRFAIEFNGVVVGSVKLTIENRFRSPRCVTRSLVCAGTVG